MQILLATWLQLAATGALGLFVGALLAEGALFVPYWRTLPAETFYALHKEYGPRLYRFFAPLTIAATMLSVLAAVVSAMTTQPGREFTMLAGALAAAMIVIYLLYFKTANARFAAASLNAEELAAELARWARWHWARVVIGIVAFTASLLGLGR